jgi:hypothetical protein
MRRQLTSAFIVFIAGAFAQTNISGGQVSGHWTQPNSPYIVNGAIALTSGNSLTIDPGVTVQFNGSYKFVVHGSLRCIGTATDSIRFTAIGSSGIWYGIKFDNSTSTADSSIFEYCRFEKANSTNASMPDNEGGALKILSPRVRVSRSLFTNCSAFSGGAIETRAGGTIINRCVFYNNTAGSCGAVSCGVPPNATIIDNDFRFNKATGTSMGYGGALGVWNNALVARNLFHDNISQSQDYSGGALYLGSSSQATVERNIFWSNASYGHAGGAIFCYANSPVIRDNLIMNNVAPTGGGIYCEGNPQIINNTIVNNGANSNGGGIAFKDASPTVRNCIIWGNRHGGTSDQIYIDNDAADPNFLYSDIEGGQSGITLGGSNNIYLGNYANNISSDPLLVNPNGVVGLSSVANQFDYRLKSGSPCLNAGDPLGTYSALDLAGATRVQNGVIEMGCYEGAFSSGVDLNEHSQWWLNAFPNPSEGRFTINGTPAGSMTVFDRQGKVVFSTESISGGTEIDLSNHLPGIYFFRCADSNTAAVRSGKLVLASRAAPR